MKNFLSGIFIFLLLFLLWECAETTDPVLPTGGQASRLLTGGASKTWLLAEVINKRTNEKLSCDSSSTWQFINRKDTLELSITQINDSCVFSRKVIYSRFLSKTKQNVLVLQFYSYIQKEGGIIRKDTIERKIITSTDKDLVLEYRSDSLNIEVIERFKAL